MLPKVAKIAARELTGFFASPAAFLFLAAFVGATLFVFFWAMAFFAHGVADVRALFQWMPVTLIFLVAALTMRSWSEERRSGTLELLLTSPTSPTQPGGSMMVRSASFPSSSAPLTRSFPSMTPKRPFGASPRAKSTSRATTRRSDAIPSSASCSAGETPRNQRPARSNSR